jgi:primosomal replication protein N
VNHQSTVVEARSPRQIAWQVEIVAFGEVAAGLARVPADKTLKLTGFIDRKGNGPLEMHVTEFGLIEE